MAKNLNPLVSVVIPFYQEKSGLLLQAVESVFAQDIDASLEIIIVDDGSPVRASEELGDLLGKTESDRLIKLIEIENIGPGGARNRGLDLVPGEREFVAFLDSDDYWDPKHLRVAVKTLDQGYDYYFCNLVHPGQSKGFFEVEEERDFPDRLLISDHRLLDGDNQCYGYIGDMLERVIFVKNDILLPSTVYRYRKFKKVRFNTIYKHMGEDYLFFAKIASITNLFAFSSIARVFCGQGVNMFVSSGPGSETYLDRLADELLYRKTAYNLYGSKPIHKKLLKRNILRIRLDAISCLFQILGNGEFNYIDKVFNYFSRDKAFIVCFPYFLTLKILRKLFSTNKEDRR